MIIVLPNSNELFTSNNNFEIVDIQVVSREGNIEIVQPNQLSLSEAYPNPFNPTTSFKVSMENEGVLNVSVFNVAGQLIDTVHEGFISAGFHQLNWNASNHASGLYIVKANDGINVISQKNNVVKIIELNISERFNSLSDIN